MRSFLPLLSSSRRWACQARCPLHTTSRCTVNGFHTYPSSPPHENEISPPTFESVGVRLNIVTALHAAFPNVKRPTEMQAGLIRTVMSGDDVLLKDQTGTGKSFGLILALLSKSRMRLVGEPDSRGHNRPGKFLITSLLIVPHPQLARQLFHWIQHIATATGAISTLPLVCQVLVRDASTPPSSQAKALRKDPPHILIATPNGALDVYKEDPDALQLGTLSTVVVDDADYLIPTVAKLRHRSEYQTKIKRAKIDQHPKPTVLLLDAIFARRISANRSGNTSERDVSCPQLVLASATLRNHLKEHALTEKHWLRKDKMTRLTGCGFVADSPLEEGYEESNLRDLGGTGITHCALIVSKDGGIMNISSAIRTPELDSNRHDTEEKEKSQALSDVVSSAPDAVVDVHEDLPEATKYAAEDSPFNPNALEAIALAFALDVPSLALLVIPSSGPVKRAVYELRTLGVDAYPFDVTRKKGGREHLLRSSPDKSQTNPTLLVSTLATIRGVDLPDLTHVFVLGLPRYRVLDTYLHVAGRVGRFWRGGKVITILEEAEAGEGVVKDDSARMNSIFKRLDITPTQFEHFD